MPRKVGIFDPGFNDVGHFIPFDRYIAELLGDDFELVFLDFGDRMRTAYEGEILIGYKPKFMEIIEPPVYPGKLTLLSFFDPRWWKRRWTDFRWIGKAIRAIEKAGVDLVIITSQTTPFIFLQHPRFPYCVVVQHPMLITSRKGLKGPTLMFAPLYDFFISNYFRFLKNAKIVFTTNDPTMPLPFPGAVWLPTNLDLREFPTENSPTAKRKFTTLGVISGAKNHDFALDAFQKFNLPFSYLIAGMPTDEVGERVKERILHFPNQNVKGKFGNLPADEYETLIRETDYLILPYDFRMQTRGASQVLYDAFRNLTPVIAPNIEPFKSYIEKYGVGFLYKEGDSESFKEVLERAAEKSKGNFEKNFRWLYDEHSFKKIKQDVSGRIKACFSDR